MEEFHYAKVSIKHQHVGMYLPRLLDNPSNKKFEINIIGAFFYARKNARHHQKPNRMDIMFE